MRFLLSKNTLKTRSKYSTEISKKRAKNTAIKACLKLKIESIFQ